eukprot:1732482-Pleurochrysis_carterae.AAC.1
MAMAMRERRGRAQESCTRAHPDGARQKREARKSSSRNARRAQLRARAPAAQRASACVCGASLGQMSVCALWLALLRVLVPAVHLG